MVPKFLKYYMVIQLFLLVAVPLLYSDSSAPLEGGIAFTEEERTYIAQSGPISAAFVTGTAPLSFLGEKGEIQGIFYEIMELISQRSGLQFSYALYDTAKELIESNATLLYGISPNYARSPMILTTPFLVAETVVFVNRFVDSNHLDEKTFALGRSDSTPPPGIKEEHILYFETREQTIDAVNRGVADYGYGNAYSVAYYILRNNYNNIVTIPRTVEIRNYSVALMENDEILLSILNKTIESLSSTEIQAIILKVASDVKRKVTLSMIGQEYGLTISLLIIVIGTVLFVALLSNYQNYKTLIRQNERYEALSNISGEYLFDYIPKTNTLTLSDKAKSLFESKEFLEQGYVTITRYLASTNLSSSNNIITLFLGPQKERQFKAVQLYSSDLKEKVEFILGKLIDISEQQREKEELLTQIKNDGLTGLYNYQTAKELISTELHNKGDTCDALILIDVDNFKEYNDTYGHLFGNKVLEHISKTLKNTFRTSDIIGRMGGDEFCIYFKNAPNPAYVLNRSETLNTKIPQTFAETTISISIGCSIVEADDTFETLFDRTDKALYEAKNRGKGQVICN